MANVQYGDTFQLRCLGYETSVADTPAGGYLAFDDSGKAITTASPLATWKFESPDGKKKGDVMIGDIVRIVNTGPNPPYPKSRDLQCVKESNAQAHADGASTDPSLSWDVYALQLIATAGTSTTQAVPIPADGFVCFSSSLAPAPYAESGNVVGEWLCIQGKASGSIGGASELYTVFTRQGLDAHVGGDTWWQITNVKAATAAPPPPPPPTPLKTGPKSCSELPPNTHFTVSAVNEEQWVRTVVVYIQGKPNKIPLAVGYSAVSKVFETGAAGPDGKCEVCIEVLDSKDKQMLLEWHTPVAVGQNEFVNIGAEKNYLSGGGKYPAETGFNDVAVTVSWALKPPSGAAD